MTEQTATGRCAGSCERIKAKPGARKSCGLCGAILTVRVTDIMPGHYEGSVGVYAESIVEVPLVEAPRMMVPLRLPLPGLVAPDPMDPSLVSDSWRSPPETLDPARLFSKLLGKGGQIAFDPCTGVGSLVNARIEVSLPDDGLAVDWVEQADGGVTWLNPPYSDPEPWVDRACDAGTRGGHVIGLVNAMTSEGWWKWAPATCFWKGRITFVSPDGNRYMTNQHPSALPYFGPNPALFEYCYSPFGKVVRA